MSVRGIRASVESDEKSLFETEFSLLLCLSFRF
jgi:hypothetical protein